MDQASWLELAGDISALIGIVSGILLVVCFGLGWRHR